MIVAPADGKKQGVSSVVTGTFVGMSFAVAARFTVDRQWNPDEEIDGGRSARPWGNGTFDSVPSTWWARLPFRPLERGLVLLRVPRLG